MAPDLLHVHYRISCNSLIGGWHQIGDMISRCFSVIYCVASLTGGWHQVGGIITRDVYIGPCIDSLIGGWHQIGVVMSQNSV